MTVCGLECIYTAGDTGGVHDAVNDDRRGFHASIGACLEFPREPDAHGGFAVDLVHGRVVRLTSIAAGGQPRARLLVDPLKTLHVDLCGWRRWCRCGLWRTGFLGAGGDRKDCDAGDRKPEVCAGRAPLKAHHS